MTPAVGFVLGCTAIAGGYQLFQAFAAWRFFRRARRTARGVPDRALPPVTVLKPLKGPGIDLYENLASFCRQDYPEFQIVCGVTHPADPAVAVVERLRRDFPRIDIVLAIGDAPGANRKVANLRQMMRYARHDVLVMSDSDIRVRRDYLRAMVVPLAGPDRDPQVALTTCLYRGVGYFGAPSVIESLFINTDFIPMVLAAQMVQRFRYAYGASIAVTREALDAIGGFASIADHLADDYQLGNRVARAGYRNVLIPYVVETVLDSITMRDVWRHQLRWARTYRVCQPAGWFFSVLTHATMWGVVSGLVLGGPAGAAVCLAAVGARLGALRAVMAVLGERETPRHLWVVPAKDLASSTIWLVAFLGNIVEWSGQRLRVLSDGRLVPLTPPVEPAVPPLEPVAMPVKTLAEAERSHPAEAAGR
jgi:ceramide glucosyltransferase